MKADDSGSSSKPARTGSSNDLAALLDLTGRLSVAGSTSGRRAPSSTPEPTAPRPARGGGDGDAAIAQATIPGQVAPAEKPASEPATPTPEPNAPGSPLFGFKQRIQQELLRRVNRHKTSFDGISDSEFRAKVQEILVGILAEPETVIPEGWTMESLLTELLNDFLGLGPLERFLADDEITEVMVNRPDQIYIERGGRLELTSARFLDENHVRSTIQRIVQPLGRHVDESIPYVDARLQDGSRVHAIIPPLALHGAKLTIRKFSRRRLTTDDLLRLDSISRPIARFLELMVRTRANLMISGGTGSGKTTLLNVLSNFIPDDQRIITVEDSAELQIHKPHVVSLESRAANVEGSGAVSIRELVRNTLRMRPDRIVVGECRGGEALDMLQAMNTGHDGSLTTVHANSPRDALARLETLVLMAGVELPSRAIREQISSAIHFVIHLSRQLDGTRKLTSIMEISGLGENNVFLTQEIFVYKQHGVDAAGRVLGRFEPTGTIPMAVERLRARGIKVPMEMFAAS